MERGLRRGFAALPEGCGAGTQEKILRTVIPNGMERCRSIVRGSLYGTMALPWSHFLKEAEASMEERTIRIGVDVGGTNTDIRAITGIGVFDTEGKSLRGKTMKRVENSAEKP